MPRLEPGQLLRVCDPAALPFTTTAELTPLDGIIGQERAVSAMEAGIGIRDAGYTGRTSPRSAWPGTLPRATCCCRRGARRWDRSTASRCSPPETTRSGGPRASRHLDAVAETVVDLLTERSVDQIVLAGDPETVGHLRERLPAPILGRVTAIVRAGRHEPAATLVQRALDALGQRQAATLAAEVDAAITEAAKGGRAVTGVAAALDAVAKGAVHRLYLLKGLREIGVRCEHCGALAPGFVRSCPFCGRDTVVTELGETLVERVVASGGRVLTVEDHAELAGRGGIVAVLRHPLGAGAAPS